MINVLVARRLPPRSHFHCSARLLSTATDMMATEPPQKISLALGAAKKPLVRPATSLKRPHAALRDADDEDHQDHSKAQTVSHFDRTAGGAIDSTKKVEERGPLVIAPQKNRDWRESSNRRKGQRSALPGGTGGSVTAQAAIEVAAEKAKVKHGLIIAEKRAQDVEDSVKETMELEATQALRAPVLQAQTDDELALAALLGTGPSKSALVLAPATVTETDAFSADFRTAPPMSSLDDYERVPVEAFGAALLRGMGWKEGEGIGAERGKKVIKAKVPERRPALLGIGAKEEAAVKEEMGSWGKGAKRGKEQVVYNPILLRNKATGEMFTEEELEKRKAADERKKYEEEFDQKEREKEKRRRRDDEPSRSDRRRDDRDADRTVPRDRDRRNRDGDRSRRHEDSEDEDRRQRQKERHRRRDDEERHGHKYERSERHGERSRDERPRDKDRDRERRR